MSKKNKPLQPQPENAAPAAGRPPEQAQQQPVAGSTVTRAQILTFWGVVALVVASAMLLDYLFPGTPERVIERWLMLPFAAYLAYFLYKHR